MLQSARLHGQPDLSSQAETSKKTSSTTVPRPLCARHPRFLWRMPDKLKLQRPHEVCSTQEARITVLFLRLRASNCWLARAGTSSRKTNHQKSYSGHLNKNLHVRRLHANAINCQRLKTSPPSASRRQRGGASEHSEPDQPC